MSGVDLISAERNRQIAYEEYSLNHDDEHTEGELGLAAIAYIQADDGDRWAYEHEHCVYTPAFSYWPWEISFWKPQDRIRNLVRAGALIAAEIDRIQRIQSCGHPRSAIVSGDEGTNYCGECAKESEK